MKSIEELIKQTPVYLHNWSEDKKFKLIADFEDVYLNKKDFEATESPWINEEYWKEEKNKMKKRLPTYDNLNILFASYGYENYSGDAFVLFEQEGKLFEVNGSHCSCYGLEGQWEPKEVILEELKNRLIKGTFGQDDDAGNEFSKELIEFLGI